MEVSPGTRLKEMSSFGYHSFVPHQLPKEIPLKQLDSDDPLDLREPKRDPSSELPLIFIYTSSIVFAVGVTIALILHIYIGEHLIFKQGLLVCDHDLCTALGQVVLQDHGSSVDAAIAAALCLGVVQPHVSSVGGGGVMLVHDIRKNETKILDFLESTPQMLKEEMLQNGLEQKAGLLVGVPGVLKGLHHAHKLYGSLSWTDVVARVTRLAREGVNVSHSLAEAIEQIQGEPLSEQFRTVFLPDGRPLVPGSVLKMPGLAAVLEGGVSSFYHGKVALEIQNQVRANGGVLSSDDIGNYSVEVAKPVEGRHEDFIVQAPPSSGAALILALKLLASFRLREKHMTGNGSHSWTLEALKATLAFVKQISFDSSVTDLLTNTLRYLNASVAQEWSSVQSYKTRPAGQVVVMGSDDLLVLVESSMSRAFGSRIATRSGVVLNSIVLDFSWPGNIQAQSHQRSRIQPGKKPVLTVLPIIVVPVRHKCGMYMALSCARSCSLNVMTKLFSFLSHRGVDDDNNNKKKNNYTLQANITLRNPQGGQKMAVWGVLRSRDTFNTLTVTAR
ncbi:glutathione hydrolase 7-like [Synchiropus picturatus]